MSEQSSIDIYTTNPGELAQTPLGAGMVDSEKLPWVHIGMEIHFKVLSCCNKTGRYSIMTKYPPGTQIPSHRHSGQVFAYTLQGKWGYVEHDFEAGPGSAVFETANSNHTLKVADDSPEDMILLSLMDGSLITYDDEGNIWAIDDCQTQTLRYLQLAKEQGLEVDESLIYRA